MAVRQGDRQCEPSQVQDYSSTWLILEVDLDYPEGLHDTHNSYPLAPEQLEITSDMLSVYFKRIQARFSVSSASVMNLIPNLINKSKYVLHYRNLQLYLDRWPNDN